MLTIGNNEVKEQLKVSIQQNKIVHSNLFIHPSGIGEINLVTNYISDIFIHFMSDRDSHIINKTIHNISNYNHPDVHYIFPTAGSNSKSLDLFPKWKNFILENPFGNLNDWYDYINVENKQGKIGVEDANYIKEITYLQTYENIYKVIIIWHAEKLNVEASNKLLKILEEECNKTIFILLTDKEDDIIPTIQSRTQKIKFNTINREEIKEYLIKYKSIDELLASSISKKCNGNINNALKYLDNDHDFMNDFFIDWIRTSFKIKNNIGSIQNIFEISQEFKKMGREKQKELLIHISNIFRAAFLYNIGIENTFFITKKFNFVSFSKYITQGNIEKINTKIEECINKIKRNLSSEMAFTELSINIARFIHN